MLKKLFSKMLAGSPSPGGKSSNSNNKSSRKRRRKMVNHAVLASANHAKFLLEVLDDDPRLLHQPEFVFLKEWFHSVLSNPIRYDLILSLSVATAPGSSPPPGSDDDSSTAVNETSHHAWKKAMIDPSQEERGTNFVRDASKSTAIVDTPPKDIITRNNSDPPSETEVPATAFTMDGSEDTAVDIRAAETDESRSKKEASLEAAATSPTRPSKQVRNKPAPRFENAAPTFKDPSAPKGARSSYNCFVNESRPSLLQENPNSKLKVNKVLGQRWKALTSQQNKPYIDMAADDKVRYQKERQEYTAKMAATSPGKMRSASQGNEQSNSEEAEVEVSVGSNSLSPSSVAKASWKGRAAQDTSHSKDGNKTPSSRNLTSRISTEPASLVGNLVECKEPEIGDRVYASANHRKEKWDWGVVKDKFVKRKRVSYSVLFDDGKFVKQLSKIASQAMLHETGLIDPEIGASSPPPEPVQRTIESLRPSKEARKTPSQKTLVSNTAGDNHNHIENKIISEESSEQELLDSTTYSSSYSSSLILAAAAAADSSADSSVGMPQEETYESEDEEKGLSGIQATKSQSSECNEADIGDRVYASAKHHNGMWYWGVVKHKFVKRKRVCYSILFDDEEYVKAVTNITSKSMVDDGGLILEPKQMLNDTTTTKKKKAALVLNIAASSSGSKKGKTAALPKVPVLQTIEPIVDSDFEFEEPKIGDRVYASANHHMGQWYWGVLENKFIKGKRLCYSVLFDDDEFVKELTSVASEAMVENEGLIPPKAATSSSRPKKRKYAALPMASSQRPKKKTQQEYRSDKISIPTASSPRLRGKKTHRPFSDGQNALCQRYGGTTGDCYYKVIVQKGRFVNGFWQYYVAHNSPKLRHWNRYVTDEELEADTVKTREQYQFQDKKGTDFPDLKTPRFQGNQKVLGYDNRDGEYCKATILQVMHETDVASNVYWHYKIHFDGWKSTFDKWVQKEELLEDTPENRAKYLCTKATPTAAVDASGEVIAKETISPKSTSRDRRGRATTGIYS